MDETKLKVIIKAIDDKKGEDINSIETRGKSPFFDYVIIATINNSRQANGIVDEIQKNLALINEEVRHIEGQNSNSEWILVDCDDVIVHLFTPSERLRINLEDLLTGKKNNARKA